MLADLLELYYIVHCTLKHGLSLGQSLTLAYVGRYHYNGVMQENPEKASLLKHLAYISKVSFLWPIYFTEYSNWTKTVKVKIELQPIEDLWPKKE